MPTLQPLQRLVVVSPHLDDAVLSCGQVLAAHPGSTVVTLFAGFPAPDAPLTEWDQRCGFPNGEQAVAHRREEDRIALSLLEARPDWLDFLDAQYAVSPTPDELAAALAERLPELSPDAVLFPLGLFHSDHVLAHQAALKALAAVPHALRLAYEDVPYRAMPGLLQQRLMALAQAGWVATPARWREEGSAAVKQRALKAYVTQVATLGPGGTDDAAAPERCWRLHEADAA